MRNCSISFAPRRLGHANLFVTDLDRSMAFYNQVCGLEEVRREPGIKAGFLTNGYAHHDVGLVQIAKDSAVGIGGYLQIAESRMKHAGLNHFGWEQENEKQLVDAYLRAKSANLNIHRTTDHQISRSVYVFDPEGNLNEFYADALADWRSVFNPDREDLVSSHWEPDAGEPSESPYYDPNPEIRRVEGAAFHSIRITHAVLVARDLEKLQNFYQNVAGLVPAANSTNGEFCALKGTNSEFDLVLFQAGEGLPPGLHHVSFEIADEDLESGLAAIDSLGYRSDIKIDNDSKRSAFVIDPDGIVVEFYRLKQNGNRLETAAAGDATLQPYLV